MNFDYRYPGSRPFEDNEHDRLVFFAREQEKQSLFHLLMSERLSVLFAKSGIGKTSLIHAGLNQLLREKNFIPVLIRLNTNHDDPIHTVYETIGNIAKRQKIEYIPGAKNSLWEYFKTVEFWNSNDVLQSPVLIFDQFGEFFTFYPPKKRKALIKELADLVRDRIPAELRKSVTPEKLFPYSETPPDVKILISIREDYLGLLEEMADDIPQIFQNRFRLLPLTREQAKEAIVKPAELKDERIQSPVFRYEDDALETILEYLCKRKKKDFIKIVNEVESFQLQLICRHIENGVAEKSDRQDKLLISKQDLLGMPDVLQKFYEEQLNQLGKKDNKKVIRLFEEGLISVSDRRLSLEQEGIERKFKVSKPVLEKLVDSRLLRAESRMGSVYYELSHDTFIEPIKNVQKERDIQKKLFRKKAIFNIFKKIYYFSKLIVVLFCCTVSFLIFYEKSYRSYFCLSLCTGFYLLKQYEMAIFMGQRAIEIDPKFKYYSLLGDLYTELEHYYEAIEIYRKSIELDPKNDSYYSKLGYLYIELKHYDDAITVYKKAIEINPTHYFHYINLGNTYCSLMQYEKAITTFNKAIELNPKTPLAKEILAHLLIITGDTEKAISLLDQILKENYFLQYNILGNQFYMICALLIENMRPESFAEMKNLIQYHQSLSEDYEKGWNYEPMKNFITGHNTLAEKDKALLLKLANALESPKAEADMKLKEIAAEIDK